MKAMLDFLEWHKEEYGHSYNHEMDLITSAKKASRYAEYYYKEKVGADKDLIERIRQMAKYSKKSSLRDALNQLLNEN